MMGVSAWWAQRGQAAVVTHKVTDKAEDDKVKQKAKLCDENGHGDFMAVVQAMNKVNEEPFNTEDEQMITAIAEQAGVALNNAAQHADEVSEAYEI